jgi:hypothetical protein
MPPASTELAADLEPDAAVPPRHQRYATGDLPVTHHVAQSLPTIFSGRTHSSNCFSVT